MNAYTSVTPALRRSEDFVRVLRTRSAASSAHFALHHVGGRPSRPPPRCPRVDAPGLSTAAPALPGSPVDDSASTGVWLGTVVPKRHARRAVTRQLLKRQIRSAVGRHAGHLASGLWVVRLKAPFDRTRFVSAASEPLKQAVRDELEALFGHAARSR